MTIPSFCSGRPLQVAAAVLALAHTSPVPLAAQSGREVGTILIAHGASAEWNAEIERIARAANTGGPLAVAYLMGDAARSHRFQDAVRDLSARGAREIVVVPLLVSSYSEHYEQIRWLAGETDSLDRATMHHLHMSGLARPTVETPLRVTPALDDAPEMARVLSDRALALATAPAQQALFLVGHGPNSAIDYAHWMTNLRRVADSVRAITGFRDVRVDLVRDDAPPHVRAEAVTRVRELIGLQRALTGRPVVVVPVLISRGRVSREKFLADLQGLDVVYSGDPLLPHAELGRWIERRVRERRVSEVH